MNGTASKMEKQWEPYRDWSLEHFDFRLNSLLKSFAVSEELFMAVALFSGY